MITSSKQISAHFHSTEFRCPHCGRIKTDENLVNKLENLFTKLQASKCIISSGYRCDVYDVQIGGFLGRHYEGLAADCVYYDKDGKIIPSKIVCCVAYDLGELNGIAKIDNNYVHLDNRSNGTYRGDETRGNSSYWSNPYTYFGVTKQEVAKYTGEVVKPDVLYQTHDKVAHKYWPNVTNYNTTNSNGYAGTLGHAVDGLRVKLSNGAKVTYQAHLKGGSWLPPVTKWDNTDDGYAGIYNKEIDGIAMKAEGCTLKYRVHLINGGWLSWVSKMDINDPNYGMAGIYGKTIDAIQIQVIE